MAARAALNLPLAPVLVPERAQGLQLPESAQG